MTDASGREHSDYYRPPMGTPLDETDGNYVIEYNNCKLTKRELFAAMAMQGLCANPVDWIDSSTEQKIADQCAKLSCLLADALIAELNKEQGV